MAQSKRRRARSSEDPQIAAAQSLFTERLRQARKQGESIQVFAARIGIPVSTMRIWLDSGALPSSHERFERLCAVGPFTREEQRDIRSAIARRRVLASIHRRDRVGVKKSPQLPVSSERAPRQRVGPPTLEERFEYLERIVFGRTGMPPALAQAAEDSRYRVGDVPLTLTRKNFTSLDLSKLSCLELHHFATYVANVLGEAQRCLLLLAQGEPDHIQKDLLHRIGAHLDELWSLYQVADSVVPIEALQVMELQRETFRKRRTEKFT